jgi:MOSC domain-containing protein YiiM
MKIISLNVGLPATRRYGDREFYTGLEKRAVASAMLRALNFEGDGQADLVHHGGPERAVCVFAADHYDHWGSVLGHPLVSGAFGENLTVTGAVETAVCVGDTFRIGEAVVQVSMPRGPCAKLAGRLGEDDLVGRLSEAGHTGFYMRVLTEGRVTAGAPFELAVRHPEGITIAAVNDLLHGRSSDRVLFERLMAVPEFAEPGRGWVSRQVQLRKL